MSKVDRFSTVINAAKVTHMSNAKWRKLFNACEAYPHTIGGVRWKYLLWDYTPLFSICASDCLMNDERFDDCGPSPYAQLREIEWIWIPKQYPDPNADPKRPLPDVQNNLDAIKSHLAQYAQFPIIDVDDGIKIIAYEW